jgi:hypothetical protein
VERQEAIMDREHITLFDPEWFFPFHFARACSVLR